MSNKDYTIIRTLDEDTCIIEEKSKKRYGVKVVSFDELDSKKPIVWDSELIEEELRAYDRSLNQKISQANKGRR